MAYGLVPPERVTLTLPDGSTLTIKKRLNSGEVRALMQRTRSAAGDGQVDALEYAFQLTVAYLLDWTTPTGAWPPIGSDQDASLRSGILNALDPDDYIAIKNAIQDHVARMAVERESEKKTIPSGEPASSVTSLLLSGSGGGTSGSLS
jgi:hypothetical protein